MTLQEGRFVLQEVDREERTGLETVLGYSGETQGVVSTAWADPRRNRCCCEAAELRSFALPEHLGWM
jgi:hypothetical protein